MTSRTLPILAISALAMNTQGPIVSAQNCPAPEYQKMFAELLQVKADVSSFSWIARQIRSKRFSGTWNKMHTATTETSASGRTDP